MAGSMQRIPPLSGAQDLQQSQHDPEVKTLHASGVHC